MTAARAALFAAGAAVAAWGAFLLVDSGLDNIIAAVWWLAGGVVAHDAVLAPLVLVVAAGSTAVLPRWARGPVAVGFMVLGTVTVVAVPVLGGGGERPDNPTLLDRNYWCGWLVLAALVASTVALASWRRLKAESRRGEEVSSP